MATVMYEITNYGTTEYEEKFKNRLVKIPAGGTYKMAKGECNQFLAKLSLDEKGRPRPKRLKAKRLGQEESKSFVCNSCGKNDFKNADEFAEHLNEHAGERYEDTELDKRLAEEKKKQFSYNCPFCDYGCNDELELKKHLKKHMVTGRKRAKKNGANTNSSLQSSQGAV